MKKNRPLLLTAWMLLGVLGLYWTAPVPLAYSAEKSTSKKQAAPEDGTLVIRQGDYPNTASMIRTARDMVGQGRIFDALKLYEYAAQAVNPEKEAILSRKITNELEQVRQIAEQELEKRRQQKIHQLYSEGQRLFNEDKLDEAEMVFRNVLEMDETHADARNFIDHLIPKRKVQMLEERQMDLERQQMDEIHNLYEQARKHFEEGELDKAREVFSQILLIDLDQREAQDFIDGRIPKAVERKPITDRERQQWMAKLGEKHEKQRAEEYKDARKKAAREFEKRQRAKAKKPAAPIDPAGQPTVLVKDIQFSGNTVFDNPALAKIVQPALGQEHTLQSLEALADEVTQYYQDGGYFLAQVLIPEQNIAAQDGVVKFTVLEGRLGVLALRGNKRYSEKKIRKVLSKVRTGDPLHKETLVRSLLVLNSYPGLKTSSTFEAGKDPGTTDILIDVQEKRRIKGSLEFNNLGVDASGKYRMSPELGFVNFFGLGDELNTKWVQAVDQGGVYYGQVSYMLPVGSDGFKLKSYGSKGSFAMGKEFASLDIDSDTLSWGVGASYPYWLSQTTSIGSEAWFEFKNYDQEVLGSVKTIEDRVRKLRFEFFNFDKQGVNGRTLANFGYHQGLGGFMGGMDSDSALSSRSFAKADNVFSKFTLGAARVQSLGKRLTVVGRAASQFSFNPLVAGEQWAIGGMDSVHGHQAGTFLGDNGYTANLETRYTLFSTDKSKYQFLVFGDYGAIHIKRPTFSQNAWEHLGGTGIGLYANIHEWIDARVDWGIPIGQKTGDNSILYFQVKYSF